MGKKRSRNKQHRAMMGIREKDLSPALRAELDQAEKALCLLNMTAQRSSLDTLSEMCWEAGVDLIGRKVMNEVGDPQTLTLEAIAKYNERMIRVGINDLLTYVCKELVPRARKFAALNVEYGHDAEGRFRAANESGFMVFPPPIAERMCAEHAQELQDLGRRGESTFHEPHPLSLMQTVTIVMGLQLIDSDQLMKSVREELDRCLVDEDSTIEDIGRLILTIGVNSNDKSY